MRGRHVEFRGTGNGTGCSPLLFDGPSSNERARRTVHGRVVYQHSASHARICMPAGKQCGSRGTLDVVVNDAGWIRARTIVC